jgi:hypothetical protein
LRESGEGVEEAGDGAEDFVGEGLAAGDGFFGISEFEVAEGGAAEAGEGEVEEFRAEEGEGKGGVGEGPEDDVGE